MVLMTIILKEYLESRHRDRCVPSPTRENRQLAPKGLGGLAVNMVMMTVRMLRMTVGMTMMPMAGLKMTIVIMTWNDCDLAGDDVCHLCSSDGLGHLGGAVGPAMYHKYKRFKRIDLVVGIDDGGGDGDGGGGGGGGG